MGEEGNNQVKLPVMAILAGGFAVPWSNKSRFIQALILTFSILVAVDHIAVLYVESLGMKVFFLYAINAIVYVGFAVTCHRLVLLGDSSVAKYGILGWSGREFRFLGWCIKIGIVVGLIFFLIGIISAMVSSYYIPIIQPMMVIMMIPIIYFSSRIILLFPATAVDKKYNLKWAYQLTDGNGFRMVVVVALIPIIMTGIDYIVSILFGENNLTDFIMLAVAYIVTIAEISAISLSYDFLSKNVNLSTVEQG